MKLGIKKVHENEWQVHMGYVAVKMDRFSLELLVITLDHLKALESGERHSVLISYVKLAEKMLLLNAAGLQILIRQIDNQDLLRLLQVAKNDQLTDSVLSNLGGLLSKQLAADLTTAAIPDKEDVKASIRRVVEKMFFLEADGQIEFGEESQQYI